MNSTEMRRLNDQSEELIRRIEIDVTCKIASSPSNFKEIKNYKHNFFRNQLKLSSIVRVVACYSL